MKLQMPQVPWLNFFFIYLMIWFYYSQKVYVKNLQITDAYIIIYCINIAFITTLQLNNENEKFLAIKRATQAMPALSAPANLT